MMAKTTQFQFPDATNSPVPRGPIPYPTKKSYLILKCSMQGCNKSPTCRLPKTRALVCTDCYKEQTGGYPLPSSKMSTGDEAGVTGGVASGKMMGPESRPDPGDGWATGGVASGKMMGPSRHNLNKAFIGGTLMNQHHGNFLIPSQTKVMVMP